MNTLFAVPEHVLSQTRKPEDLAKMEYAKNWNEKLDCSSYTTLRLASNYKYKVGRRYAVYLKGKRVHDAEIVDIKTISIEQINEWIARVDMGFDRDKCISVIQSMYKHSFVNWETQKLNWILFRKLDI